MLYIFLQHKTVIPTLEFLYKTRERKCNRKGIFDVHSAQDNADGNDVDENNNGNANVEDNAKLHDIMNHEPYNHRPRHKSSSSAI